MKMIFSTLNCPRHLTTFVLAFQNALTIEFSWRWRLGANYWMMEVCSQGVNHPRREMSTLVLQQFATSRHRHENSKKKDVLKSQDNVLQMSQGNRVWTKSSLWRKIRETNIFRFPMLVWKSRKNTSYAYLSTVRHGSSSPQKFKSKDVLKSHDGVL